MYLLHAFTFSQLRKSLLRTSWFRTQGSLDLLSSFGRAEDGAQGLANASSPTELSQYLTILFLSSFHFYSFFVVVTAFCLFVLDRI